MKILSDGTTEEIYNGPGSSAWDIAGKMQKNGQRDMMLSKLAKLMEEVPQEKRLPKIIE